MIAAADTIRLEEFRPAQFAATAFSQAEALEIDRRYGKQVELWYPSPRTAGEYRMVNRGWVGFLPLSSGRVLELTPKVPIGNLFRMLEYVYGFTGFEFLDGLTDCGSIADLYQRLARLLARMVRARLRRGVFRRYEARQERLSCIRGRLDVRDVMTRGWDAGRRCDFQEHSGDVDENRLLAWSLERVLRSGLCVESETASLVRSAYRELLAVCGVGVFSAEDCGRFLYSRLNEDYRPMHALCRFFLENSGPVLEGGGRAMVPFRVDMARLFEEFVAAWLREQLPDGLEVSAQETKAVGGPVPVVLRADIVVRDVATGEAVVVMDTKYKRDQVPQAGDLEQVLAYTEVYGCRFGVLVYPNRVEQGYRCVVGGKQIESVGMGLGQTGDIRRQVLRSPELVDSGVSQSPTEGRFLSLISSRGGRQSASRY